MVACYLAGLSEPPTGRKGLDRAEIADALDSLGVELLAEPGGGAAVVFADTEVEAARRRAPGRVLVVTPPDLGVEPEQVWSLLDSGASDVICWRGPDTAVEVAARLARWAEVDALAESELIRERILGRSRRWLETIRAVVEVARFTSAPTLLVGESGTGKELLARAIHDLDARPRKGAFVVVDCTTVVPTLSGSEFFGHERGAFTGAVSARDGAFALADGGTLFLDEVGELPLQLQAELLRVIQEGTYKRVGGNVWHATRFRLVCATNRDLESEEAAGRFRRDLYFRIAGAVITTPTLRERPDDVLPLFRTFVAEQLEHRPELEPAVVSYLLRREWPGNVRELRQLAIRVAHMHVGPGAITAGDIPDDERPCRDGDPGLDDSVFEAAVRRALVVGHSMRDISRRTTDIAVRIALADSDGHVRTAARALGITERALQLRLQDASRGRSGEPGIGVGGEGADIATADEWSGRATADAGEQPQ